MEIWKPLRNFPNYNGSSEGRIMNVRTQHILKPIYNEKGYVQVSLFRNNKAYTVRIHKIIAETFLGEHPGMDVRHKDNDRTNNRVDNLYWTTRKETINDAFRSGSKKPPRQIPVKVVETGKVYESIRECSRDTGCDPSEIRKQIDGRIRHVKGLHFKEEKPYTKGL